MEHLKEASVSFKQVEACTELPSSQSSNPRAAKDSWMHVPAAAATLSSVWRSISLGNLRKPYKHLLGNVRIPEVVMQTLDLHELPEILFWYNIISIF